MVAPAWARARRVLCVRLDNLGDVLMCTPAWRALRAALPGRELCLLGSGAGVAAQAHIPELDAALAYAAPWVRHTPPAVADPGIVARLRAGRFDAAIIFTCFSQSALPAALLCLQAGIPLRLAHSRENPYDLLSDWVPDPEPAQGIRHEVQRQLDLVAHVAGPVRPAALSFAPGVQAAAALARRLRRAGLAPGHAYLVIHAGASAPSRRWPPGHWSALLPLLAAAPGLPLVLTGSQEEQKLTRAIASDAGVPLIDLAGQLSLGELGALIAGAAALVAGNTGPVHLAAAVGTPVVVLYAQTNPQHTPWQVAQRVLHHPVDCGPCFRSQCPLGHHACLVQVQPRQVQRAVCELLEETGRATSGGTDAGRRGSRAAPQSVLSDTALPCHSGRA